MKFRAYRGSSSYDAKHYAAHRIMASRFRNKLPFRPHLSANDVTTAVLTPRLLNHLNQRLATLLPGTTAAELRPNKASQRVK